MFEQFKNAKLKHLAAKHPQGHAFKTIIKPQDFNNATSEISTWKNYTPTPLHPLKSLAQSLEIADILYKDESPRFGLGSFKALGGAYAALRLLQREMARELNRDVSSEEIHNQSLAESIKKITLCAATDGNHGRSLAWGAQKFGAPCRIYIHKEVSEGRAQAMRNYGAEIIRVDADYDESVRIASQESQKNNWFVISDTSWEHYTQIPTDVMAGYGVMIDEICSQISQEPTHLFIQAGVGGLAAAVTARLRQKFNTSTKIIVVEPELAACIFESAKKGTSTPVSIHQETLMAGLSCGEPSPLAWNILKEEAQNFLTIPENLVGPSMRLAARPIKNDPPIKAGESAICGLAALIAAAQQPSLKEKLNLNAHSRVLIIGSEGATDPEIYNQIMQEA
jgi:diaminopropionate ammonia-lyase